MKGWYNRFRLCTKGGDLLDDEEVLQQDMPYAEYKHDDPPLGTEVLMFTLSGQ